MANTFKKGDKVQYRDQVGTVITVGVIYTLIKLSDRREVAVHNSDLRKVEE